MIEWSDEGILLSSKPYGEKTLLAHIFTPQRGQTKGILYKNSSKTPLQIGVHLAIRWKARLETHMGRFEVDLLPSPHVFLSFDTPRALTQLQHMCHLLTRVLPENHPYPTLFQEFLGFLKSLPTERADFCQAFFQLHLLETLGYGLDFSNCVVTGTCDNLTYVSPKSGCAVSQKVAEPYRNKLLSLPSFLRKGEAWEKVLNLPSPQEVDAALKLTHFFIDKHLLRI